MPIKQKFVEVSEWEGEGAGTMQLKSAQRESRGESDDEKGI